MYLTKKGCTIIPSGYLESLSKVSLPRADWAVLTAVIRHSWGEGRSDVVMTGNRMAELTNLSMDHVRKTLRDLRYRNMLTKIGVDSMRRSVYEIQQDADRWKDGPRKKKS